ncbi:uncharacterized protein LOC114303229 [Camellia sinensis]|uniref:uncharacterized protein LOC114303229 n=1 Tax=Camellia sinensis TaxID=4442 RepID=UPI001036D71A|nr:uncharacterized protein LOC114303229 [Camellia sinensis]
MKIQSWNTRGIGRPEKRRKIKKGVVERKVDIILLQETKKSKISISLIRSMWPGDRFEFLAVDAVGRAGGLLCIWNPAVFQLMDSCCNHSFLLLSGTLFSSFPCVIVNVYAPNDVVKRQELWASLVNLKPNFPGPWCLGGDFNEIRNLSERVGCSNRDRGMRDFNTMIEQMDLLDIRW